MMKWTALCSAAAAVGAFALVAGDARAQDTISFSAPFSGTFLSTAIDSNADGLGALQQSVRVPDGPLGPSTIEGLNELIVVGPATCRNGNPGTQLRQRRNVAAPSALVQRFEQSGDLLLLSFTTALACLDASTSTIFLDATAAITGGTGELEGSTGTLTVTGQGTLPFASGGNLFGAQLGTIDLTITRP